MTGLQFFALWAVCLCLGIAFKVDALVMLAVPVGIPAVLGLLLSADKPWTD